MSRILTSVSAAALVMAIVAVATPAAAVGCVQIVGVNCLFIRTGPGTGYGDIGSLKAGTRIWVHNTTCPNGWCRIVTKGRAAYFAKRIRRVSADKCPKQHKISYQC